MCRPRRPLERQIQIRAWLAGALRPSCHVRLAVRTGDAGAASCAGARSSAWTAFLETLAVVVPHLGVRIAPLLSGIAWGQAEAATARAVHAFNTGNVERALQESAALGAARLHRPGALLFGPAPSHEGHGADARVASNHMPLTMQRSPTQPPGPHARRRSRVADLLPLSAGTRTRSASCHISITKLRSPAQPPGANGRSRSRVAQLLPQSAGTRVVVTNPDTARAPSRRRSSCCTTSPVSLSLNQRFHSLEKTS